MLQLVRKKFEGDNNHIFRPGNIVDTAGWANASVLLEGGYIGPTDAKEATKITTKVKSATPSVISAASTSRNKSVARPKRASVLTGRKQVFARKVKQGD